eukprot:snap_masked-scaffold_16-processed-gene-4.19-mRNA-1 protein AED:1.00 eAED:1.00 QI:0/0/0/0/1/1/2/0/60
MILVRKQRQRYGWRAIVYVCACHFGTIKLIAVFCVVFYEDVFIFVFLVYSKKCLDMSENI